MESSWKRQLSCNIVRTLQNSRICWSQFYPVFLYKILQLSKGVLIRHLFQIIQQVEAWWKSRYASIPTSSADSCTILPASNCLPDLGPSFFWVLLSLIFQLILNSMHKYQPRVHIIRKRDHTASVINLKSEEMKTFTFSETNFIGVTAYQNQLVSFLCF